MEWLRPVAFTCFPHLGGFAGGYITAKNIPGWYKKIKKAPWNPPNWVFGPVWTTLYTGMGYASYLVWRDGGGFEGEDAKLPLALYGTQLALNWAWTPIFFGAHKTGLALLDIITMGGTIMGCIYTFHSVNKTASYLMMPYMAWVTLATTLNYYVWRNNKEPIDESHDD